MPMNTASSDDGDVTTLRVHGDGTFVQAVAAVRAGIAAAKAAGARRLLIDGRDVRGFPTPGVGERHWMVREWTAVADPRMRLAFVVPAALLDPELFAVVAAANFGFTANAFTEDAPAREWLARDA
jgi:hypothetical protein